jgi:hypothetical protein
MHHHIRISEAAYKRNVIKKLHRCYFCKRFIDSKTHMILKCSEFNNQRAQIIQTIINSNGSYDKNNLLTTLMIRIHTMPL